MERQIIIEKFGSPFVADELSFKMGIDKRFSDHLASRYRNLIVLETCSGGGFSSISLAKYAKHVYSFDINKSRIEAAKENSIIAGVNSKITFIHDDIYNGIKQSELMKRIEASFIDPDWADSNINHVYKFIGSNTKPPSDHLLNTILEINPNATLVQPPFIPVVEFSHLPNHELECLYINNSLELYCLHFGTMAKINGERKYKV
jgi:16S rRNA G966 N2-methylase RsmD